MTTDQPRTSGWLLYPSLQPAYAWGWDAYHIVPTSDGHFACYFLNESRIATQETLASAQDACERHAYFVMRPLEWNDYESTSYRRVWLSTNSLYTLSRRWGHGLPASYSVDAHQCFSMPGIHHGPYATLREAE